MLDGPFFEGYSSGLKNARSLSITDCPYADRDEAAAWNIGFTSGAKTGRELAELKHKLTPFNSLSSVVLDSGFRAYNAGMGMTLPAVEHPVTVFVEDQHLAYERMVAKYDQLSYKLDVCPDGDWVEVLETTRESK